MGYCGKCGERFGYRVDGTFGPLGPLFTHPAAPAVPDKLRSGLYELARKWRRMSRTEPDGETSHFMVRFAEEMESLLSQYESHTAPTGETKE